ncbi:MAG: heavy-metal-associated domain-containing protein [Bacteroidota bacterium]|nr:heavy-metal-associated domain-containing protein [Bacteroidota bacterium]
MKILKFKTNVNCDGCISNVTPYLNEVKGISKWTVDTANPSKILTVESEGALPEDVISALKAAGYKADEI